MAFSKRVFVLALFQFAWVCTTEGYRDHHRNPKDPGSLDHSIYKREDGKHYSRTLDVHLPKEEGMHLNGNNRTIVMTKIHYKNYTDEERFEHFDPYKKIPSPQEKVGYIQRFHLENGTFMVWSTPRKRYITEYEMSFIEFDDKKPPQAQFHDESGKPYDIIYNIADGSRYRWKARMRRGKMKGKYKRFGGAVVDARLRAAAANGDYNLCRKLLNYEHADINAADEDGNTPVHYAHAGGWVHIVRYFAQHGGDLERANGAGLWPYDVYEEMAKDDEILADLHHEMQMVHYNHFVRDRKSGRKPKTWEPGSKKYHHRRGQPMGHVLPSGNPETVWHKPNHHNYHPDNEHSEHPPEKRIKKMHHQQRL
jgi:ankyrin repeat protein